MMEDLMSNSLLQNNEKQMTSHSARKTLAKKLKQQQVPKSDIISITRHNHEAGLNAHDSSIQVQHKQLPHFSDDHQPTASKNKCSNSPQNPVIPSPSFSFFPNDDQLYQNISVSNPLCFDNCKVHFHMNNILQSVWKFCCWFQKKKHLWKLLLVKIPFPL